MDVVTRHILTQTEINLLVPRKNFFFVATDACIVKGSTAGPWISPIRSTICCLSVIPSSRLAWLWQMSVNSFGRVNFKWCAFRSADIDTILCAQWSNSDYMLACRSCKWQCLNYYFHQICIRSPTCSPLTQKHRKTSQCQNCIQQP